jgi:endonuclease/exonuclease/phosphatase family metal-dependent hydrolase
VVVGDLNLPPTTSNREYRALTTASGSADAWAVARGPAGGATAFQTPDLDQQNSLLDQRIDYALYPTGRFVATDAQVVGGGQADRTPPRANAPFGLWPSDHAAVVATLRPVQP